MMIAHAALQFSTVVLEPTSDEYLDEWPIWLGLAGMKPTNQSNAMDYETPSVTRHNKASS